MTNTSSLSAKHYNRRRQRVHQRKQVSALKPYFQNPVAEANVTMRKIQERTGREIEVIITPGPENPTDMITRGTGTAADISS